MKRLNRFIIVYYVVLLLAMVLKQGNTEPPVLLRICFLIAVVLPTVINRNISYPAIITMFTTLTLYGFSYSYMPYTYNLYVLLTILITILFLVTKKKSSKIPIFFVLFSLYVFIIDIITGVELSNARLFEDCLYSLLIIICFYNITESDEDNHIDQISWCFIIVSILFSAVFLINRDAFTEYYDYEKNFERTGWTDPNYFGTILGIGTLVAMLKLFNEIRMPVYERIICILTIIITIPVLLLNASRGALLSVAIAGALVIIYTRIKFGYKVLLFFGIVLALLFLYNNQYMDLLMYRVTNDNYKDGSGRVAIWIDKLDNYVNGDFFNLLFGYGYRRGLSISGSFIGFHNDFLAFLVEYGIVGVVSFVYMLVYPIIKTPRNSKQFPSVLCIMVYLIITCMTIEPITSGRLPYYVFYLQALLLMKKSKSISAVL